MTDQVPLSPFASAAPALIGLGYHVVTILPPTATHHTGRGKAPGEVVSGVWRGLPKWQNLRDAPASKFTVDLWSRYPDANIGLVLGSPIGQDRLIAVDVDTTDPDRLRDILGTLPYSPMVKRGAKGETRFYRAPASIKSTPYDDEAQKALDKAAEVAGSEYRLVDLLTGFDCRQTVCPPSVHPGGAVYVWLEGPVPASQLPMFGEDEKLELEETLAGMGWLPPAQRAGVRAKRAVTGPLPDSDDYFTETKVAALANMDAWVHDLDVYGLQAARGGYEAVATWRASCTGRPICDRKRNLSIQREGIKDFGTNWTGSAIDLVMEAQGLDQAAATTWLRLRLGLMGDVIVLDQQPRRIEPPISAQPAANAFTPDIPAREDSGGFTPDPAQIFPLGKIGPDTIEAWVGDQPLKVAPVVRAPPAGELPEHLTQVPGLVGRITDWIVATAKAPQRGLSMGAAITLVGTAAGRKVAGPTDSGTHLYVLAIAGTGTGKDHPLKCIGRILSASAMKAHNGPSQFMSMSALINTLTRQPLTLSAMDEFGSFLKRVNGAKAGNHEQAISGIMRQVWGSSFGEIETPAYAQSSSKTLTSPAFSIFGASTAEEFYAAVEGDDVLNGFLNRFLTISTKIRPAEQDPQLSVFEIPEPISKGMVDIYNIGGALLGATMHGTGASAPAVKVPWDHPQALHVYNTMGAEIRGREEDEAFLSRTREMAVRLATIRAIGVSTLQPRITVDDMQWGRDVAMWSANRMIQDATDYMAVNEHQATAMRILRALKAKGRVKHTELLRAMNNRLRAREFGEHLDSLVQSGQVELELVRPDSGGTPVRWYTAT